VAAEDPSVSGVSGRYATALFELARDEKSIDAVKADLDRFAAMLNDSEDLKRLVRSPVFAADVQLKALSAVLEKAGIRVIALTPEQSKFGAVETPDEARRCAELFRKHREEIDGILVQLPLPPQIDRQRVIDAIDPAKDVDGANPTSLGRLMTGLPTFAPATAAAVLALAVAAVARRGAVTVAPFSSL